MAISVDQTHSILERLEQFGVPCLLFGGWAEEAFGIAAPRDHRDIDLLLPANSFSSLDKLLNSQSAELTEIRLKRFAHKRAFRCEGTVVEIILVQESEQSAVTLFWGNNPFHWKLPLEEECTLGGRRLRVVSRENLVFYRQHHALTQPDRWKDPASLLQ